MADGRELRDLFERDLRRIALPPEQEWFPTGPAAAARIARGERHSWKLALLAVAALVVFGILVAGPLLAGRQERLTPAATPTATPAATLGVGSISGTVRSAATGLPIRGAIIGIVYDDPVCCRGTNRGTTDVLTDEAGRYRQLVFNGRYKIEAFVALSPFYLNLPQSPYLPVGASPADAIAYAPRWFGDTSDFQNARVVEVTAGGDIAGVDVALVIGHSISGYVTSSRGAGISLAIQVFAGGSSQCCVQITMAGVPDGHYAIAVPNGVYRIRFRGPPTGPGPDDPQYHYQWWRGADEPVGSRGAQQQYFATATDIVVQDADVTGIDAVIPYN